MLGRNVCSLRVRWDHVFQQLSSPRGGRRLLAAGPVPLGVGTVQKLGSLPAPLEVRPPSGGVLSGSRRKLLGYPSYVRIVAGGRRVDRLRRRFGMPQYLQRHPKRENLPSVHLSVIHRQPSPASRTRGAVAVADGHG